jgi:hypothetical protein
MMTSESPEARHNRRIDARTYKNYQVFESAPIGEEVADTDPALLKRPALEAVMLELLETEDAEFRIVIKLDLSRGGQEPCVAIGIQPDRFEEEPGNPGDIVMSLEEWMDAFEQAYGLCDVDNVMWTKICVVRDLDFYSNLFPPSANALRGFMLEYPGALNYLNRLVYESYASSTMRTGVGFLVEIPGALNNASLLLGVSRADEEDQKITAEDFDD